MIKNYIVTAIRNIYKNRVISIINIFGLSVGISSCILIFMYVSNELSYDRHHSKKDRLFRVTSILNLSGQDDPISLSSFMLTPTLKEEYPEVEEAVRLMPISKQTLWYEDKVFQINDVFFADAPFFTLLDYQFIEGDPATCLKEPKSIVISDELARMFFGTDQGVIGKMLKFTLNNYKITGVFKDIKNNSHIHANAFISINSIQPNFENLLKTDWFYMAQTNYVLFKQPLDQAGKEEFEGKLKQLVEKHVMPWLKSENVHGSITYRLQNIADIRLNSSDLKHEYAQVSKKSNIYIFSSIGLLILVIACINYLNLATARSSKRSKEVGIRKTAGAGRGQLFFQFIGESLVTVLFSLVVALCLVELLLPAFNHLADKTFSLSFDIKFIAALFAGVIIIGILSGLYPAYFLSKFQPVNVLKAAQLPSSGPAIFRKVLVVVQFTIAVFMISCTLIVYGQMHYMKTKNPGFDNSEVLVFKVPAADSSFTSKMQEVKNDLLSNPDITEIAGTSQVPGDYGGKLLQYITYKGKAEEKIVSFMLVDDHFLDLLKINLREGRNFNKNIASDDTAAFIVNEAAVREFGWTDLKDVTIANAFGYNGKIIGVTNDFHYMPLQNPIEPLVLMYNKNISGNLMLKVRGDNAKATVAFAESTWKKYSKKYPTEFFFLDENFKAKYATEEKMLTIFGYFSIVAIVIACLGLFGLVSFSIEQRTKEIGIRKVTGASLGQIVFILLRSYAVLVFISIVIAIPCAYLYMQKWLTTFAYRIEPNIFHFLLATFIAILIALLTVIWQALKAATANPALSLRYE